CRATRPSRTCRRGRSGGGRSSGRRTRGRPCCARRSIRWLCASRLALRELFRFSLRLPELGAEGVHPPTQGVALAPLRVVAQGAGVVVKRVDRGDAVVVDVQEHLVEDGLPEVADTDFFPAQPGAVNDCTYDSILGVGAHG